jgi:rubrerythrin
VNLFRKAGEMFEETKRTFIDGETNEFVCESCETLVEENYEYCPHCGAEAVERVE